MTTDGTDCRGERLTFQALGGRAVKVNGYLRRNPTAWGTIS